MTDKRFVKGDLAPGLGQKVAPHSAACAGEVCIVGMPQMLHTRTAGDLDVLFVPLLEGARGAMAFLQKLCTNGEARQQALNMGGIYLTSELLKDASFSLFMQTTVEENKYVVDLSSGTLNASARLYAVVSRRTSLFRVEIVGDILQGPYLVRNPRDGSVILRVEEEQLRKPGFFGSFLAEECLREQMEREQLGRFNTEANASPEVRLTVSVGSENVPVVLRQKGNGEEWDVIDTRTRQWIGGLPPGARDLLRQLTSAISEMVKGR
jgi:hypothetical protein